MAAARPWWQTTKTARWGFVTATAWTGLGLIWLLWVAHNTIGFVTAAAWLALGGVNLASGVALRRRERTGTPGQPGRPPS